MGVQRTQRILITNYTFRIAYYKNFSVPLLCVSVVSVRKKSKI